MSALADRATLLAALSRDPDLVKQVVRTVRHRVRSDEDAVGLRRDLDVPFAAPQARIGIEVRPIRHEDVPRILGTENELSPEEKWQRVSRLRLLEAGTGTCYVAVTDEDVPCYVQWMFSHRDNDFVQHYYHGSFPVLDEETALLENAFTPTAFRGQQIMSAAMSQIAERGRTVGARYVTTFVGVDNTASLKGCRRAGFDVYVQRTRHWSLLRSSVAFCPVAS